MPQAHDLKALTATQVIANLARIEGWRLSGDGDAVVIEKSFDFADYYQVISFVNAVAFIAHAHNHHPDLTVSYHQCCVRWRTHEASGISPADFECAMRVDALLT